MDDDMGMAMAMVAELEDLDQVVMLAMSSPAGSSATSSSATAAATTPPAAAGGVSEDEAAADLRRGPWSVDEDMLLVNYIAVHGEGRWNALARSAGLKRTGKSCRLRWLNYLRPDVRRGNMTAAEQLLILELHARWGNRWSKIAQHLPGRTDNEVKNYWRTRVQKHARHLRCDANSARFRDVVRHLWMPRLRERALAEREAPAAAPMAVQAPAAATTASAPPSGYNYYHRHNLQQQGAHHQQYYSEELGGWTAAATALISPDDDASSALRPSSLTAADDASHYAAAYTSSATATTPTTNEGHRPTTTDNDGFAGTTWSESELLATTTATGSDDDSSSNMSTISLPDFGFGDLEDSLWSLDDLCSFAYSSCAELTC